MKTIKVKVEHNAMYWTSVVLTVLFAWVIFPIKWLRQLRFNIRKRSALHKAQRQSKHTRLSIYVCQWGDNFFVGTRKQLRLFVDKIGNKAVRRYTNSHMYDVDFRKSVIAKFQWGEQKEMSDDSGTEKRISE
jgi:hypothetical protein